MTNLISGRILGYLDALRTSLDLPAEQSQPVVDEVSADLMGHVQRHIEAGATEEDAVAAAITELGPPHQLGAQMKSAIPPLPAAGIRNLRKTAAIMLGLAMLWFLWNIRAWDYGFSWGRVVAFLSVTLPIILVVWPDIVWRQDWMFRFFPTALVLVGCFLMMTVGVSTEYVNGEATTEPLISLNVARIGICVAFASLSFYLLWMVQRRQQRIAAVSLVLIVVAAIEIPFLVEESYWTQRLNVVQQSLEEAKAADGAYPSDVSFLNGKHIGFLYRPTRRGEQYTLIWDRVLNGHFALGFSSEGNRVWVLD